MALQKRKRSVNWMASEKNLLIDIVSMHFPIVENKKTDNASVRKKLDEWKIISDEFNSETMLNHRTAENLKAQWENMKKAAKKQASNTRMEMIKSGGGPPSIKKEDVISSKILSLLNTSAAGHNTYDSESVLELVYGGSENVPNEEPKAETDIQETLKEEEIPVVLDVADGDKNDPLVELKDRDCGDHNPLRLRAPISTLVRQRNETWASRRLPTHHSKTPSWEELHRKKIEAIEFQNELASKETAKSNSIKDLELKIKEEILKQEKIKTRILLLELKSKRMNFKRRKC